MTKKKATQQQPSALDQAIEARKHDEELRYRAKRWAELHANPKSRVEMDVQLRGLSDADQRLVYLNGQRIRAGLPYKTIQPEPRKETDEKPTKRRRAPHTASARATSAKGGS